MVFSTTVLCTPVEVRKAPTIPTEDSFYQVPGDINNFAAGTIIRYRKPPTPISALRLLPVPLKDSWQILYRTNDNLDKATATVLTVLIPHNADFSKVHSYQAAEDAASPNCAPSYAFQLGVDNAGLFGDVLTDYALLVIQIMLQQGWVVVVPDHQGPLGAFLANKLAGRATLDGIRAALHSANFTGIANNPRSPLWGYSGGSIATAAAAELQPVYAPELHIAGAAVGGLVPNIMQSITGMNNSSRSGLLISGLVGLANQYPELRNEINDHLLPQYQPDIEAAGSQCFGNNDLKFKDRDIVDMFDDPLLFSSEPAKSIIMSNDLGKSAPTIPLYVYKATTDKVSPIEDTNALVKYYCSQGTKVLYETDLLSDHTSLSITGVGRALKWLGKIMDGEQGPDRCTTKRVVFSLLDLNKLDNISSSLYQAFLKLLNGGN